MKKIYFLLIVLLCSSFIVNGQTYLTEDFSADQMPPTGWTIDGYSNQWSTSGSDEAGGIPPEAKFTWTNGTGVSRLISPEVDLTGVSDVNISFNHFLDNYSSGPKIGVATRSGGGDWHIVWEVNTTSNIGPEERIIAVTNDDVGQSDFQFCIYLDGNFYNLDYWYIDNIELYTPYPLDAKLTVINTPWYLYGVDEVTGRVKNRGINDITSLAVSWSVDSGDTSTTSFEGLSLATGDSYNFTCEDLFDFPVGDHMLDVWISGVNDGIDDDTDNNLLMKTIHVASYAGSRTPLFEEFTSSTCAPCAGFNNQFVPWCDDHSDQITLVKYQMSWPAPGDPYYTEEGGVRRAYYGVSFVPDLYGNGSQVGTTIGAVNTFFNEAVQLPGFASAVGSHTFNGTEITATVNLVPYANYTDFKLYIVVFEYLTTGNVGNNGETEFEHVMMKMIPDAEGATLNLQDREPYSLTQTVDLAGTNVEEWDDLGVAFIFQDYGSKEVFQSGYSLEDAVYNTDAALSFLFVDGSSVPGFDPAVYDYYVELPEGSTEIPDVLAIAADENATVVVVPASELRDNVTTIDVFAEDHSAHNRYTVTFTVATGMNDIENEQVKVFPNPTSGMLYIESNKTANASLYSANGSRVGEYSVSGTQQIDLSELPNGIYFIKIKTEDSVTTKKISLTK